MDVSKPRSPQHRGGALQRASSAHPPAAGLRIPAPDLQCLKGYRRALPPR